MPSMKDALPFDPYEPFTFGPAGRGGLSRRWSTELRFGLWLLKSQQNPVGCWGAFKSLTWWKYHHRVAHSIMAIWRVGELAGLKSLLLGFEIEEINSASLCNVGLLYLWTCVNLGRYVSSSVSRSAWGSGS